MPSTPIPAAPRPTIGRRSVLLGAAGLAGAAVLSACGTERSTAATGSTNVLLSPDNSSSSLIALFGTAQDYGYAVTGSPQRLAFAIGGPDGSPTLDVPASLDVQISRDGNPVGSPITVAAHRDGVPLAYFPLRTTFDQPGDYQAATTVAGQQTSQPFSVVSPGDTKLVPRGAAMIPFDTPTVADHRGVEPICTRATPCPFHTVTLTEALAAGTPVAFLAATPQFSEVGVSGPELELLIALAPAHPEVTVVHAEVYANAEAILNGTDPSGTAPPGVSPAQQATLAPVVDAYGLTYEPALFLADASGRVVDRLDNVFDRAEIDAGLAQLTA